jgi:hypothetical protein
MLLLRVFLFDKEQLFGILVYILVRRQNQGRKTLAYLRGILLLLYFKIVL